MPAPATRPAATQRGMVELDLKLPPPTTIETPKRMPPNTTAEKLTLVPRPPTFVTPGVHLLSKGKPVKASDEDPTLGSLKMVTDGDKSGSEASFVELGPYKQWVQIDLGSPAEVHAIALWHAHHTRSIYKGVVVQVSNDADFASGVETVYNNDHLNTVGLGKGTEREYWETHEGKVIVVPAIKARYVRCYSKGNTDDDMNRYTEVEVYGK